jgi:hypothetical protein
VHWLFQQQGEDRCPDVAAAGTTSSAAPMPTAAPAEIAASRSVPGVPAEAEIIEIPHEFTSFPAPSGPLLPWISSARTS